MSDTLSSYYVDRLPQPGELTFRMIDAAGSSIGVHFPPGLDADELAANTRALVVGAFARGNPHWNPASPDNYTFEVLTQATLDHIQNLEYALEACRNAMLDIDESAVPDEDRWTEILDAASATLGDDDEDH